MPCHKSAATHVTMMLCLVVAMLTINFVEASDTWAPTGVMSTPRTNHTATLLPDGRVLVSGGGSAEIYNPALGMWSATSQMRASRYHHTATLLPSGRVLVSGGSPDFSSALGSAEIYNPALGAWSPTPSMSTARFLHTATLLQDGRVLVSGGSPDGSTALGSAEIYNPALGTWSPTTSMNTARFLHTATLLQDGRVLVTGGEVDWNSSTSAEIYDPAMGTWLLTGSMTAQFGRERHTATLLLDGQVLVSGGAASYYYDAGDGGIYGDYWLWETAEIYDPVSGTWSATASMRAGTRYHHMSTSLSDGRVLVSGGVGGTAYSYSTFLASAEIYDPALGTWSRTAAMSTPRVVHTATSLADGRVLVSGGSAAVNTTLASAEIYSPGAPAPEDATPPHVSCAAIDGAWRSTDVTITCTASDLGSGLANSADANFSLTTNVPVGTETVNAVTNSRQVCDLDGNCSTAGPFTGNKVDKKAPTIAIASPTTGATYGVNAKVAAGYACTDGGAGMTSCAGPVANGSLINTSPMGTRTFVVTATDAVGNSSTRSVTYTVSSRKK
jgi:Galactose oxidase, central domain/Kelch motif